MKRWLILSLFCASLALADIAVIVRREAITEIDDEQQTTNTTARYVFSLPPDDRRIGQLQDALTTSVDAPAIAVSNQIAAASLRLLGWVGDTDNVTVVLP